MRQLFPGSRPISEPESIYDDVELPVASGRPYVVINMVSTIDGRITVGGRVKDIGSPVDHALLARLRAAADAVLRGAGTVRSNPVFPAAPGDLAAERVEQGLAPQPRLVIISESLDLPWDKRFITDAPQPPIVLTAGPADRLQPGRLEAARSVAEVRFSGSTRFSWLEALRLLRDDYGIKRIVCEGGPMVNWGLMEAGLIDEIFWTVAPKTGGGTDDLTMVAGPRPLPMVNFELVSAYLHQSELFLRYRRP